MSYCDDSVCNVFVQASRVTEETYPTFLHMLQNICVIVTLQRQRALIKLVNDARFKANIVCNCSVCNQKISATYFSTCDSLLLD